MVRIGLSIYLMLVTLAGPLLCPCSMPQFFSQSTPPNADATPDIALRCPCCPKPPATSADLPRGDQRPAPAQAPCRCPSHGHGVIAMLPQRAQQAGAAFADLLGGLQLDVLFRRADFASLGVVMLASAPLSAPFSLSPADRLHVFCLLRC